MKKSFAGIAVIMFSAVVAHAQYYDDVPSKVPANVVFAIADNADTVAAANKARLIEANAAADAAVAREFGIGARCGFLDEPPRIYTDDYLARMKQELEKEKKRPKLEARPTIPPPLPRDAQARAVGPSGKDASQQKAVVGAFDGNSPDCAKAAAEAYTSLVSGAQAFRLHTSHQL